MNFVSYAWVFLLSYYQKKGAGGSSMSRGYPFDLPSCMNAFPALVNYHTKVYLTFKIKRKFVVELLMNGL